MTRLALALESALESAGAATALAEAVEAALGDPQAVAGAFVLSTAAAGRTGEDVGRRLAARWPGAELLGTSFEGLLLDGRVWQGEPAVAVLAWTAGEGAPVPIVCEAGQRDPDVLAKEILSAGERVVPGPDDLVLLFPDALGPPSLRPLLDRFSPDFGGPWLAGAAASGVDGSPASSWAFPADPGESEPLVGLLFPGRPMPGRPARVQCAGATRLASPWLEITACRTHWIDALEGEPPIVWIRRQLGLDEAAPIEPHLDRLLLRLAGPPGREAGRAAKRGPEIEPDAFDELYVSGLDPRRGAVGVLGALARGDRVALALPDAGWAREALRAAVDALPASPIVLQLGCPSRGESLHGDRDIESAVVAHQAVGRRTLGVLAPFQLGSDPTGVARLRVHSTVLAAIGPDVGPTANGDPSGPSHGPKNSHPPRSI
jgi:small ligand-binding sensory domain FIST